MGKRIHRVALNSIQNRTLDLGYVGENEHTQVIFGCAEVFNDYPEATAVLKVRPNGFEIYEPSITIDEMDVIWTLSSSELQRNESGAYQLTFTSGTEIMKSAIGAYTIHSSLNYNG